MAASHAVNCQIKEIKFNDIELNCIMKDDVNIVVLTLQSLSAYVEVWSAECWQRSATSGFRDN